MRSVVANLDLLGDLATESSRVRWGGGDDLRAFLSECVESGTPLDAELSRLNLGYDDLRYSVDRQVNTDLPMAPLLDSGKKSKPTIPLVSFFTGSGGLDLGFESAGFETLVAIEHNELFCRTLRHNRPAWNVLGPPEHTGDVSRADELEPQLRHFLGKRPFEGMFVGGPPCQPFSIAANQRFSKSGTNFKRVGFAHSTNGNLLFDYVRLIGIFQPRAFLIENVPGLLELDDGAQVERACSILAAAGYAIARPTILDAAFFGVPQHRRRVFIVGVRGRRGSFLFPQPLTRKFACGPVLARPLGAVLNHITRNHSAESVLRYMELDYGERDKLGRVDRLDPTKPSKTVIAGGVSGGGRSHLHPHIPRTLSVRECARLQTFPDDYEFLGPAARQFTQVGNAVPPVLGAALARQLRKLVFRG